MTARVHPAAHARETSVLVTKQAMSHHGALDARDGCAVPETVN
jgi:predicted aconitase with swiveling domain